MNITFREAEPSEEDARKILTWRNDPLVRQMSFNQEEILWENHWPWYKNKLSEGKTHYLFSQIDGKDFGVVRFDDLENNHGEINVFLAPDYRGKGLGRVTLRKACKYALDKYKYTKIIAEIKKENIASVKAFQKAGFTNLRETTKIIKDSEIPIYVCEYLKMKLGIGIRTSELELLEEAKKLYEQGIISYIEIVFNKEISSEQVNKIIELKIPLTVHGPYYPNVNIADESSSDHNWKQVKQAYELAEKISAKYFILHPGFKDHLNKSFRGGPETSLTFIRRLKEIETTPKILLENNPYLGLNDYEMYLSKPEDLKNIEICLDFRHAATVAANLNILLEEVFRRFQKSRPRYSHICGGPINDKHEICTSFSDHNEYDWKLIKEIVDSTESQMLTIETPRKSKTSLSENIEDLKIISEQYV